MYLIRRLYWEHMSEAKRLRSCGHHQVWPLRAALGNMGQSIPTPYLRMPITSFIRPDDILHVGGSSGTIEGTPASHGSPRSSTRQSPLCLGPYTEGNAKPYRLKEHWKPLQVSFSSSGVTSISKCYRGVCMYSMFFRGFLTDPVW